MIDAPQDSALRKLITQRPQTVGVAIWPYQCSGWTAATRFARIQDHYSVVERIGGVTDFSPEEKISLLNLSEIREDLEVILDQPVWFMREGQLSINLFLCGKRIYTLTFSFFEQQNGFGALIGAIQGRDIEGALDAYREITKAANGMRPRDLLFEIFRMFCCELGVSDIIAVSEDYRHHKDRQYFREQRKPSASYDEIWQERGGARIDSMFFQFKVGEPERDLASIPAKKRGMYRRRLEMLRRIRSQMHESCTDSTQRKKVDLIASAI
jgi:uncharacterized protein VirK/YbjX